MEVVQDVLEQVVFEVTYRCNLRCAFCYNSWKAVEYPASRELGPEEYRRLLQGMPPARMFALSGGEPTVREDLLEVIEVLEEVNPRMSLITNGVNLDEAYVSRLAEHEMRVQLPVHGLGDRQDAVMGVPGAFKRLVRAFIHLKEHSLVTSTSTVVSTENLDDLERILEFCIAAGSRYLLLIRFLPGGAGLDRLDLLMDAQQTARAYEVLDRVCGYYGVAGGVGVPNVPCVIDEERYKHVQFNYCGAGREWFVVDPSGNLRICNHSPTIYGNLLERPYGEILENPVLRAFAASEVYPPQCEGCDELEYCRGGCRAVAETMYGDLYAPDPLHVMPQAPPAPCSSPVGPQKASR